MSASRLWSASTDSKLGSFRQNSLMPGLTVTCRPIEIGFVWSESLELWLETHVPADRDSVRLVKILIVDDRLRQSFTEFCFRGIDDLIVRYLLSSTFLSSELIQFATSNHMRPARLLQEGNQEFSAQPPTDAFWHRLPARIRRTHCHFVGATNRSIRSDGRPSRRESHYTAGSSTPS